jgi:NADP-dependent 3-hydroxy acid dehydrogenase YdfG
MTSMNDWMGRVALVTGASSGIGRATALALAEAGMKVVGCARRLDPLNALKDEVENLGGSFLPVQTDLRDEGQILSMFRTIEEQLGGVDVLVNNAGLGHAAPLSSGATEKWREMLEVNVLALSICTREAVKGMQERNTRGHVVHISSMSGHRVPGGSGMYSATKFAVRSLTEGLRAELRKAGSNIRVSAISPGYVETEFAERYHGNKQAAEDTYSRFKVLEAKDIADAVLFVLSSPEHMQVHDVLIRPTEQTS